MEQVQTILQILAVMKAKKYKVFTRPYELNIVGIRSTEEPNKFDDAIFVFFKDDQGNWILKQQGQDLFEIEKINFDKISTNSQKDSAYPDKRGINICCK